MSGLLLRNVRPLGGDSTNVRVRDGRIAELGATQHDDASGDAIECHNEILLPGFVDAHGHVDKTLWTLPWRPRAEGTTVRELVANERRLRKTLPGSVKERCAVLMRECANRGTSYLRTHVDVDPEVGLSGVEAVLEARAEMEEQLTVELVAFPQSGLLSAPPTLELLEEAVKIGVDVVGGIDPALFDAEPAAHLDAIFGLAERQGCGLDIHLHEAGELGVWEIDQVVERTKALSLEGRVMISHAFCLAQAPDATQARLCAALADAGIAIVTVAPGASEIPPLHRLREAGVVVCCGSDGIRDLWTPYGNGDMLERTMMLAYRAGFRLDEDLAYALEIATYGGATALQLDGYGLEPGCYADLVLVRAETVAEAVVARPSRTLVMKRGVILTSERAESNA